MSKKKDIDDWDFSTPTKRCYESHPALVIGDHQIYGGSCSHQIIKDADVYIGFDAGMPRTYRSFPWEEQTEFLFRIADMNPPDNPETFKKLIDWMALQLIAGKKVHAGCIGGHGRTGTVFAALVNVMTGEKDAITYVREHYCKKAVESFSQVEFLHKHFGIVQVAGAKSHYGGKGTSNVITSDRWSSAAYPSISRGKTATQLPLESRKRDKNEYHVSPARNAKLMIWGDKVRELLDKRDQFDTITL